MFDVDVYSVSMLDPAVWQDRGIRNGTFPQEVFKQKKKVHLFSFWYDYSHSWLWKNIVIWIITPVVHCLKVSVSISVLIKSNHDDYTYVMFIKCLLN